MQPNTVMFLFLGSSLGTVAWSRGLTATNPFEQVLTLLQEMEADVQADALKDTENYEEYLSWCNTSKTDHTDQVATQTDAIASLKSDIETLLAEEADLAIGIKSDQKSIANEKKALALATSIRKKEADSHRAEVADLRETVDLLGRAVLVLSKVQLLQKSNRSLRATSLKSLVSNLHSVVHAVHGKMRNYPSRMQKDVWDFIGSLDGSLSSDAQLPSSSAALAQRGGNEPEIPGIPDTSYNARSNSVYGMLDQMRRDFEEDLSKAISAEDTAQSHYDTTTGTMQTTITDLSGALETKEQALSQKVLDLERSRGDLADTENALAKDQKFLSELEEACFTSTEDYNERNATRNEEIRALGEAITILANESSEVTNFFQADQRKDYSRNSDTVDEHQYQHQHNSRTVDALAARATIQRKLLNDALRQVLHAAKMHQNWALASLAVRMRLDNFTSVEKAMDDMVFLLKSQQQTDVEMRDECIRELREAEDDIRKINREEKALTGTKNRFSDEATALGDELAALADSVAAVEAELEERSAARTAAHQEFRSAVFVQRAAANLLRKAVARLKMFYAPDAFLQTHQNNASTDDQLDDPPAVKEHKVRYEKHEAHAGVVELINHLIDNAAKMDAELTTTEQHDQDSYAIFANDCAARIAADKKAITVKTLAQKTAQDGELSTDSELQKLNLDTYTEQQGATMERCNPVLEHFNERQAARADEIEALGEAKAILNGADFS